MGDADRRGFVCPPTSGSVDGIELALLDPAVEDERRILIEAEHPELAPALDDDRHAIGFDDDEMNPRLHIAMHEIVSNQLWDDEPPEMWQTAERLTAAGYDRHEVLHMLGSVVADQVWGALVKKVPYDIEQVRADLVALPEAWEAQREELPIEPSRNRAERRAEERRRRSGR
jgi:hypothetical protein